MQLVLFLVFGLFVGLLARAIMPGNQRLGLLATTALGVIGSFLGGFLANLIFTGRVDQPATAGWIGSLVGALVVLFIAMRFWGRRSTTVHI